MLKVLGVGTFTNAWNVVMQVAWAAGRRRKDVPAQE